MRGSEDGDIETEFCYFVIKFGKPDNGTVSESFGERSARFRNPNGKAVDKINGKTAGDEFAEPSWSFQNGIFGLLLFAPGFVA